MRGPKERICQRRHQMVVHSYIYYRLCESVVSDDQWQAWANELAYLQSQHPELMSIGVWDDYFEDWTGETGYHLPQSREVHRMATFLLDAYHDNRYMSEY